jgi:hypothetical protein
MANAKYLHLWTLTVSALIFNGIGRVLWARTAHKDGASNLNIIEIIVNPIFFRFITAPGPPSTLTPYLFAISSTVA